MPDTHAILSASGAHRWLACTRSARIEAELPDNAGAAAAEGTLAHEVAEQRLKNLLAKEPITIKLDEINAEMQEAVDRYVDTCMEKINEAWRESPDAEVHVEERLDFSEWVPEGFGTGDMVIMSDEYIEVIDLKYGKGVPVSAVENPQMRLYALGLYAKYGTLYGADKVRMTIVQPRLDSISSDELTVKELLAWGNDVVGPKAQLAWKGKGDFVAGDHCRFCKARATCRKLAEYELEGIKEDTRPAQLTDIEIAEIVQRADDIKKWLTSVEEFALQQALDGTEWPGLKVVAGRSVRKITDAERAAELLTSGGYTDIYKPQELKTLTALEKLVGKKKLADMLADVLDKPAGKPTLVPESDKRPPMEIETAAAKDFDDSLL